jgi:Ca2+/Na+ antiporter
LRGIYFILSLTICIFILAFILHDYRCYLYFIYVITTPYFLLFFLLDYYQYSYKYNTRLSVIYSIYLFSSHFLFDTSLPDDYCSWIQKINEESLLKFGNTFNNAKNAWQGSADKGKNSVELNLLEIEKWAAAQSTMEEEEDEEEEEDDSSDDEESDEEDSEEEEESDEGEEESGGDEEKDKEDEKESNNINAVENSSDQMINKQSLDHDSNTGKAGTIPEYLRPKLPPASDPTDYLAMRIAETSRLTGSMEGEEGTAKVQVLLTSLKGLSLTGQDAQQSTRGHEIRNKASSHSGISVFSDDNATNTMKGSNGGLADCTSTHSKSESEGEGESRMENSSGSGSGSGSGIGNSSSDRNISTSISSGNSSFISIAATANSNSCSDSSQDLHSNWNGQMSPDTHTNSSNSGSGSGSGTKNNRANVRTLMEGPWAQDSSTSLNPSRPCITVISSQDYPPSAMGPNSENITAGKESLDNIKIDTSVSKKCKIDEII